MPNDSSHVSQRPCFLARLSCTTLPCRRLSFSNTCPRENKVWNRHSGSRAIIWVTALAEIMRYNSSAYANNTEIITLQLGPVALNTASLGDTRTRIFNSITCPFGLTSVEICFINQSVMVLFSTLLLQNWKFKIRFFSFGVYLQNS